MLHPVPRSRRRTLTRYLIVTAPAQAARARETVLSVLRADPSSAVWVVDLGGTYRPTGPETVLDPGSIGLTAHALHVDAIRSGSQMLATRLLPHALRSLLDDDPGPVVTLQPGGILLRPPSALLTLAEKDGLAVVSRAYPLASLEGRPSAADLLGRGGLAPEIIAVAAGARRLLLDRWAELAAVTHDTDLWLAVLAAEFPHGTVRDPAFLLSSWSLGRHDTLAATPADGGLLLTGRPVTAVDLSRFDGTRPWVLDTEWADDPRMLLSNQPVLADFCARHAGALVSAKDPWDRLSTGDLVDDAIRHAYRSTTHDDEPAPPDPFEPAEQARLLDWLSSPVDGPRGHGVPRYLLAVHATRPDLSQRFPHVPGAHTRDFLGWARRHGRDELPGAAVLLDECLRRSLGPVDAPPKRSARRAKGIDIVGFLTGELGIGESARLVISALNAAGIPHRDVAVSSHLQSKQRAGAPRPPDAGARHDIALICVNADLTPTVSDTIADSLDGQYRIGMWYWEIEDFPPSQHGGFAHVDEIWVATDFVRDAVSAHSAVPVRVMTPPLLQRQDSAPIGRAELALPADRPVVLFVFDYLSTAERKNPWGVVEAFRRAYPRRDRRSDGPVLVVKSINAGRRVADAERLRLVVGDDPDIILLEDYLSAEDRDALMAACDVYLSLHRSEGLGLTLAEAMSWGKPVIATGYSGNLQFMDAANSYLVPWSPVAIPAGCEPYPAGSTWAEPDLDAAAALLRRVLENPAAADQVGRRAAHDIRELHSPAAAGRPMAERLEEIWTERRRHRRRRAVATAVRRAIAGLRRRVRRLRPS